MTDETTGKHHAWEQTDKDGVVWEYRYQYDDEQGNGEWLYRDDVLKDWVCEIKDPTLFCGTTYRRRKPLPYATCTDPTTGRECRVYFEEADGDTEGWEWMLAYGGWKAARNFQTGCIYRRKQAAE